ncbi:MAG TPA: hypothetical protein VJU60_02205 [Thermoleophilaceae bacterium]|nr:hypothetical protein [Thermoleophilaceae bacterium]
MRRAAVVAALVLFAALPAAAGASDEPVSLTVTAPAGVASGVGFPVHVQVASDPGALGAATAPLRVRVKAAGECGASFDSTPGTVLLDAPLGPSQSAAGTAVMQSFGTFTACAFLEQQGDDRLFAFDDSTSFAVTHGCTTYTKRAAAQRRRLRALRSAERHAHGARRAKIARTVSKTRATLRRVNARRLKVCHG